MHEKACSHVCCLSSTVSMDKNARESMLDVVIVEAVCRAVAYSGIVFASLAHVAAVIERHRQRHIQNETDRLSVGARARAMPLAAGLEHGKVRPQISWEKLTWLHIDRCRGPTISNGMLRWVSNRQLLEPCECQMSHHAFMVRLGAAVGRAEIQSSVRTRRTDPACVKVYSNTIQFILSACENVLQRDCEIVA